MNHSSANNRQSKGSNNRSSGNRSNGNYNAQSNYRSSNSRSNGNYNAQSNYRSNGNRSAGNYSVQSNANSKVQLLVNSFRINIDKICKEMFLYNIDINLQSSVDGGDQNSPERKISKDLKLELLLDAVEPLCASMKPLITDGEKNFYSFEKLNINGEHSSELRRGRRVYIVNVTTPPSSHQQNLANLLRLKDSKNEIQLLNIILKSVKLNSLPYELLDQNLFLINSDAEQFRFKMVSGRRNINPLNYGQFGFNLNSRLVETGLIGTMDQVIGTFVYGGPLQELIENLRLNLTEDKSLRLNLTKDKEFYKLIEDSIKGLKCQTTHLKKNRTFTIAGITDSKIKDTKFEIEVDGATVKKSVFDYFKEKYPKIRLNQEYPCVKGINKNFYPLEVCLLIKNQESKASESEEIKRFLQDKSSKQKPNDRFKIIKDHLKVYADKANEYLASLGVSIDQELIQVDAKILPAPLIHYANRSISNWSLREMGKFIKGANIGSKWCLINIYADDKRDFSIKANDLIESLVSRGRERGMVLEEPIQRININYRGKNTLDFDLFKKLDRSVELLVVLLPDTHFAPNQIYDEIKSLSACRYGLKTQCLKKSKSYWYDRDNQIAYSAIINILLQINAKMGGINHTIDFSAIDFLKQSPQQKCMVVGLDVTHSGRGEVLKESIATCVTSYSDDYTSCHMEFKIQERSNLEIIDLTEMMKKSLNFFKSKRTVYPSKILVYRDGIGEGSFDEVIKTELRSIQNALKSLNIKAKVTIILVQKRHNTRFQLVDNPTQNVSSGTLVNSVIVNPKYSEFVLCSHSGNLGTTKPIKYEILHDENKLKLDEIYKMTYYFCHLYPDCVKPISIPMHCYYAHLSAYEVRSFIKHYYDQSTRTNSLEDLISVSEKLNGTLFYL